MRVTYQDKLSHQERMAVRKILQDRLKDELISVSFTDIEEDNDQLVVVVKMTVRPRDAQPGHRASFFGLTRAVQNVIGNDLLPVFKTVAISP